MDLSAFLRASAALMSQGRPAEARRRLERAAAAVPDAGLVAHLLAIGAGMNGDDAGALVWLRRSLLLDSGDGDNRLATLAGAALNRAGALTAADLLSEAAAAVRLAVAIAPGQPEGQGALGALAARSGRWTEAAEAFGRARRLGDGNAAAPLGHALVMAGRAGEAAAAARDALERAPDAPATWGALALALVRTGHRAAGLAAGQRAAALAPECGDVWNAASGAALEGGRPAAAAALAARALRLDGSAAAASHLALARIRLGQLGGAIAAARASAAIAPGLTEAWMARSAAELAAGRVDPAVAAGERACRLSPDRATVLSNRLMACQFLDTAEPEELAALARGFGVRFGHPAAFRPVGDADPERRLRLGFLSSDFRQHVASCFFEPLLARLDRRRVEAVCYSDTAAPDAVTERLRTQADGWLDCAAMGDEELAARIGRDGVDILIDLAGHSAGNRLTLLARRPAPVQATWLGYPDTTGLDAVDARLVDAVTDPEGEADAFAAETLVRLPNGFLCYRPPAWTPEVGPPPALETGAVTFGSFNKPAKIAPLTVGLWAETLRRAPGSRLLLKGLPFAEAAFRNQFRARFAARGVDGGRLEFVPWTPGWREHLELYRRIDIALDAFPYNGTTTTCEALWMGVPVVTWAGRRHAARVGASLLARVGLPDLVGRDKAGFVAAAVGLAGDPARLSALRRNLRGMMRASPLCDEEGFARQFEEACRGLWRRRCEDAAGWR